MGEVYSRKRRVEDDQIAGGTDVGRKSFGPWRKNGIYVDRRAATLILATWG
jgi:hypothetical protein